MRLMTETGYWIAGQIKTKTGRIMLTVIYNLPPRLLVWYFTKGCFHIYKPMPIPYKEVFTPLIFFFKTNAIFVRLFPGTI